MMYVKTKDIHSPSTVKHGYKEIPWMGDITSL